MCQLNPAQITQIGDGQITARLLWSHTQLVLIPEGMMSVIVTDGVAQYAPPNTDGSSLKAGTLVLVEVRQQLPYGTFEAYKWAPSTKEAVAARQLTLPQSLQNKTAE